MIERAPEPFCPRWSRVPRIDAKKTGQRDNIRLIQNEPAKRLWRALNHPATLANLSFVSKSYGGGALKTEPRQLDQLEIPQSVLDEVGLGRLKTMGQPVLFDKPRHAKRRLSSRKRKLAA